MEELFTDKVKRYIAKVEYHRFNPSTLTVCVITTISGFTVTGESACVRPENFSKQMGEELAYSDAFNKLVEFEAYVLCTKNFNEARIEWAAEKEGVYAKREREWAETNKAISETDYAIPTVELPFLTRLKTERNKLDAKIKKIVVFAFEQFALELQKKPTADISNHQVDLLAKQAVHMQNYLKILDERIADLTKE